MIIKKISLMYTYTLKIIINKITYSLGQLRKKQSHQIIDTISKYLLRCLVALYITWFLMTSILYAFFSTIGLPHETINLVYFCLIIIGVAIIIGLPVNQELIYYIVNSNLPRIRKQQLIIYHTLSGVVISFGILLLLGLPFIFVSLIFFQLDGLKLILQMYFIFLVAGFLVDLLKFFIFHYRIYVPQRMSLFLQSVLYIFTILLVPYLAKLIVNLTKGIFVLEHHRRTEFTSELVHILPNLLDIDFSYFVLGLMIILGTIYLIVYFSRKVYTLSQKHKPQYQTRKKLQKSLYICLHFFRKHGLINHTFVISILVTLLISQSMNDDLLTGYSIILLPIFFFIYMFMLNDNSPNVILLFKQHKIPIVMCSFFYSLYLLIQFGVFQMTMLFVSNAYSSISFFIESTMFGLLLIFTIIITYCMVVYILDGIVEPDLIISMSRWSFYAYICTLSVLFLIISGLTNIPEFMIKILLPMFVNGILLLGLQTIRNRHHGKSVNF